MLIILVRHAEREYRPDRADRDQVLTAKGHQTATRLGRHLAHRLQADMLPFHRILSSSYVRALETARLLAPELGLTVAQVEAVPALQTDGEGALDEAQELILAAAQAGVIAVGHGPELALLCRRLTGVPVELKKAHALAIAGEVEAGRGQILWRISHKEA